MGFARKSKTRDVKTLSSDEVIKEGTRRRSEAGWGLSLNEVRAEAKALEAAVGWRSSMRARDQVAIIVSFSMTAF